MAASFTYDFKYLYRLLRADEHPDEYGIIPTNPFAHVDVQDQILYGTFLKSQFISTASSLEGLLKFARRAKTRPLRIAVIKVKPLMEAKQVGIYNLNDKAIQQYYFNSMDAIRRVGITKQVLINGTIPAPSILCVAEKHCRYENLYRLLRTDEETVPKQLVAKDATAYVTIEEFILKGTEAVSQFISMCASQESVKRFAASATNDKKVIAKIDVTKLEDTGTAIFIDLSLDENIDRYLKTEAAKSKAKEAKEVLIIGSVPKNCIELLGIQ